MRGRALVVWCAVAIACRLPTRESEENAPVRPSSPGAPVATAPAAPQPTPSPTPAANEAETPVPPPDVPLEGRWPIREYTVEIEAPAGAWLSSYHAAFGLDFAFGDGGKFRRNHSAIEIRTNCEGRCEPHTFDERIQNEKATRAFELVKQPRVEWIVRPTKLRDGAWWMHIRGLDDEGKTVVESVDVAFMAPQSERGWLECVLRLEGPELARLDELTQWCRDLRWTYVGEEAERVDARFGGRYHLETATLELPAIAGFRLEEYAPAEGRLRFRGEANVLGALSAPPRT